MDEMNIKVQDYKTVHTQKQQIDAYDLWKICFGDTKEYMDNYFVWRLKENEIIALYDNEVITSMIHLNPYPIIVSGKKIEANYIVGVATRPEYRKQGLMRKLLTKSLAKMYNDGHEFTYLMPASDKIYLPFDFRYVYEQHRWKIKLSQTDSLTWVGEQEIDQVQAASIQAFDEKTNQLQIKKLNCNDQKELFRLTSYINHMLSKSQEIYAKRDSHYYNRLQADMKSAGGDVVLLYKEDELVGCISYMLEGNYAEITESIVNITDTRNIITLIMNRIVSQWMDKVEFIDKGNKNKENLEIAFLESYYMDRLTLNETGFEEEIKPIIMARIVNLSNFVKHLSSKKPLSIIIKVEDSILTKNQGVWELKFQKKSKDIYSCELIPTNHSPELTLDIATLTELFFGYKTADEWNQKEFSKEVFEKLNEINMIHKVYLNEIV